MSDKQTIDKKEKEWKDFLLKSSLPLEQLVSEKLEDNHFGIAGEYSYIRSNEQDVNTEFSIDLHAYRHLKRKSRSREGNIDAKLSLLIECKYNYPGVKWVFSPYYRSTSMFLCSYWLQKDWDHAGFNLEIDFPLCIRGIELNNSGFDPNTISRGLSQLYYGMPNLIIEEAKYIPSKNEFWPVDETHIILILVTTADLYVLKSRLNIQTYLSAVSLDDVAEKVDTLIVLKERGSHLRQYCERLFRQYCERLLLPRKNKDDTDNIIFRKHVDDIFPRTYQVIVVQLDAFDSTLEMINAAIKR